MARRQKVLILGGSSLANDLARQLAAGGQATPVLSLAGRTANPVLPPVACRIGGFGGADGLAAYLASEKIGFAVNATHPFAAQISANAEAACASLDMPLLRLQPRPWERQESDLWTDACAYGEAARALGSAPARVFLTHGRLNLAPFAAAAQHFYLIRSIEPPDDLALLPRHKLLLARGPFERDAEEELLRSQRIDWLVTKNSGGAATYAKIEAARRLRVPVVMLARPAPGGAPQAHAVADALAWIAAHGAAS